MSEQNERRQANSTSAVEKPRGNLRRFLDELNRWQNLISAMIALGAASWAWQYTQRQIEISREQLAVAASQADSAQRQIALAAKQAENSQKQLALLELDQRPYIWPEDRDGPKYEESRGIVYWNWDCKNIGKSPAVDVRVDTDMTITTASKTLTEKRTKVSIPVVPVVSHIWSTAYSAPGWSKKEFEAALRIERGIKLVIRLKYSDGRGSLYELQRCFAMAADGIVSSCD